MKIEKPDAEWRAQLTPEQYRVTRKKGTEPAFSGAYWDNHAEGTYRCIGCDAPLFASAHKFDSGTGWPSYFDPIEAEHIEKRADDSLSLRRVEVRSKDADSHLGHVFDDGPREAGGLRYCINSASLRFIPLEQLDAEGYGEFRRLFV